MYSFNHQNPYETSTVSISVLQICTLRLTEVILPVIDLTIKLQVKGLGLKSRQSDDKI